MRDIYTKWSPIMDALKVTDEDKRKFMAEYAEFHQNNDNYNEEFTDIVQNLLPISMKILSQLNLTGKNVVLKEDGLTPIEFSVEIDRNEVERIKETIETIPFPFEFDEIGDKKMKEMREYGVIVQKLENVLQDKLVKYINDELEIKNNLLITKLAQSIRLISTEELSPRMYITSRIYIY